MKKINWNIGLLLLAIMIIGVCLFVASGAEFGGTDDAATGVISEITQNNYQPWFESITDPATFGGEGLLFSLQSALGAGLLFYCIGYFVGRKSKKTND